MGEPVGDVVVTATEGASINAITFAASIGLGFGAVGIAVGLAGAGSSNVILTSTRAFVFNTELL
ncbi:MAG: hypothetical protein GWO04_08060, partial [Actinobacteria bacterium]|nr:hypothetical protein [Actinomycetota bacterium]